MGGWCCADVSDDGVVVSGDVVLADETLWTTEAFVVTCWRSRASDRDNVCGKDVIEVLPAIVLVLRRRCGRLRCRGVWSW